MKQEFVQKKREVWKFNLVMIVIMFGFLAVIGRLFSIQVVNAERYKERARNQHESTIELKAERGDIFDRNGRLLATTIKSYSIAVDPKMLQFKDSICKALAFGTGKKTNSYLDKINSTKNSFVWLERRINPIAAEKVKQIRDRGLIIIEEPRRTYPFGTTGAQIVGLTNVDNQGLAGIELGMDSLLAGDNGFVIMYKDAGGRLRHSIDLPRVEPTKGNSVQLSIDIELQRIAEFELARGVEKAMASAGTLVALDPETGEILAMASYPPFDPHNPQKYGNEGLRMRSITDVFEPGSTFKMITAAAALEENLVFEDEVLDGKLGLDVYPSFRIRDDHPMGKVTFRKAVEQSSNIILAEVASRLSDSKFYSYVRNFGFGLPLGIDIPGEVSGKIQKPQNFNATSKRFMGHGYGLNATPLQIVNSYATVANGGVMMKPHVIKRVFNENNQFDLNYAPEKIRRVISEKTADRIHNLFVNVVDSGTGRRARINEMKIVGKTGTAQQITNGRYSKSDYYASFVGYFPANDPKIAMIVVIDRPRTSIYGGASAAPIFQAVSASWASVDAKITAAMPPPKRNRAMLNGEVVADLVVVPSVCGMEVGDARNMLDKYGLELSKEYKDGIVFTQYPKAGDTVFAGKNVIITMKSAGEFFDKTKDTNLFVEADGEKHNVKGLTLRRALNILRNAGVETRVYGEGMVYKQTWTKEKEKQISNLYCR